MALCAKKAHPENRWSQTVTQKVAFDSARVTASGTYKPFQIVVDMSLDQYILQDFQ